MSNTRARPSTHQSPRKGTAPTSTRQAQNPSTSLRHLHVTKTEPAYRLTAFSLFLKSYSS